MKRIRVLGITGGVGAGKSMVLAYLQKAYGAGALQLDEVAHRLMEPGESCYGPILAEFGSDILDGKKNIDRPALYARTFCDPGRLRTLNQIVHPRVKEYVRHWIAEKREEAAAPLLVLEAALLLEDHYEKICDEIWFISVKEEVRRERLLNSRGYSAQKTAQILENQKTEAEFRASCQFVVDNSSDILENTYRQIDKGLREHDFV